MVIIFSQSFFYGFPSGVGQWRSMMIGSCLRKVSCAAWGSSGTWRQETTRPEISRLRFAALEMTGRRGAVAEHSGRKLFADSFLSDLGPLVEHGDRKLLADSFPSGVGRLRIISIGNPFSSLLKVLNFSAILVYNEGIDTVWKGGPL